jgi:S-adenosylmethionine:tRNA ribosyltransferase-isomerase
LEGLPAPLNELKSEDFSYLLPDEAIARFPLEQRDASRLLVWEKGEIRHRQFRQISDELPSNSLLILNDTKVLPARLHFQKSSGAWIELLILEHNPGNFPGTMVCKAMVGNKKKWREDEILVLKTNNEGEELQLEAIWENRENDILMLRWNPSNRIFPEILAMWGEMPIPPYLNRKAEKSDLIDYQTVYAENPGAVAAPTAGLHFTEDVLKSLEKKNIESLRLTLHVGLGTFKPMKSEKVAEHEMHPEEVKVSLELIQALAKHEGPLIAVGTTSVRSLESLYWLALHCMENGLFPNYLESAEPYLWVEKAKPYREVFQNLLVWMQQENQKELSFQTRLYLMPGYHFRVITGMVTNFHQPGSTLVVLVAAFMGEDWKKVYGEALANNYRFLSYGDSSLLIRN